VPSVLRRAGRALAASLVVAAVSAPPAPADVEGNAVAVTSLAGGAKRIKYRIGPFDVVPGQNRSTGIAYPIADGDVQFESGTLGSAVPPATGALAWKTPANLGPGTYTYFCRIHPFMRGAFRVKG
jgi:hypothetical protein